MHIIQSNDYPNSFLISWHYQVWDSLQENENSCSGLKPLAFSQTRSLQRRFLEKFFNISFSSGRTSKMCRSKHFTLKVQNWIRKHWKEKSENIWYLQRVSHSFPFYLTEQSGDRQALMAKLESRSAARLFDRSDIGVHRVNTADPATSRALQKKAYHILKSILSLPKVWNPN